MKEEFKVGDTVRFIAENYWVPIGHESMVVELDGKDNMPRVVGLDGVCYWVSPEHIELVSQPIEKIKINEMAAKYPGAMDALKELFPGHSFSSELISFNGALKELAKVSDMAFGDPLAMQVAKGWANNYPKYKGKCLGVSGRFDVSLEEGLDSTIIIITKK